MKIIKSSSIRYEGQILSLLDQTLLPHQQKWLSCNDVHTLVEIIHRLAIRGAPAIGISSALFLALRAEKGDTREQLDEQIRLLQAARPTAVNLKNNLRRLRQSFEEPDFPQSVVRAAEEIFDEDIQLCQNIARLGGELIASGEKILTHCNTGSLATAGCGTALGIIAEAQRQHGNIFVWIDETRPLLQGARLTAWECLQNDIAHSIICDGTAAMLMSRKEVDKVIVGSDRIAVNGDFANKIGTYALAVLAKYHGVPFFVAAPQTTVDPGCASGSQIPIEVRSDEEIKGVKGSFGSCSWSPAESAAYNPAFDVTPAELVSGWILDSGVFSEQDMQRKRWWLKQDKPE